MKLNALLFQETTGKTFYTYEGETVIKRKDGYYFESDGTQVLDTEGLEKHTTPSRESWAFPVKGESNGKKLTDSRIKEVADKIAECLIFSADRSTVKGRKFTTFSLNKEIHILVNLNGTPILDTKDLRNLFNTFRMTYTRTNEGKAERGQFTHEELSEGIYNIFLLADKINEVFKF